MIVKNKQINLRYGWKFAIVKINKENDLWLKSKTTFSIVILVITSNCPWINFIDMKIWWIDCKYMGNMYSWHCIMKCNDNIYIYNNTQNKILGSYIWWEAIHYGGICINNRVRTHRWKNYFINLKGIRSKDEKIWNHVFFNLGYRVIFKTLHDKLKCNI